MHDEDEEDQFRKDNLGPIKMNSLKKVRTETMKKPLRNRKLTVDPFQDDATSEGSYMVKMPNANANLPDEMQSQSSYMLKMPDNK